MSKFKKYEVYICRHNETIVYIGCGLRGRHAHCDSGVSHVYNLNKVHFTEGKGKLVVDIVLETDINEEARDLEEELIMRYKPINNFKILGRKDCLVTRKSMMIAYKLGLFKLGFKVGGMKFDMYSNEFEIFSSIFEPKQYYRGVNISVKYLSSVNGLKTFAERIHSGNLKYIDHIFDVVKHEDRTYTFTLKDWVSEIKSDTNLFDGVEVARLLNTYYV